MIFQKHQHVAEDVCFYMISSYGWSYVRQWSYEPKHIKILHFYWFFGGKRPLFSLKIEILKIRKHRHVAEDVCFHIKSSYSHSHAYPLRSVELYAVTPHFQPIGHLEFDCSENNMDCDLDLFLTFYSNFSPTEAILTEI